MKSEDFAKNDPMFHDKDSYDSNLLVRLSALTKGPLLERRAQIRKSFVIAPLSKYQPGLVFDVEALSKDIKKMTKCEVNDENIISILNQLEHEGLVKHIIELKYKIIKNIEVPKFKQSTQPTWEEFLPFLMEGYPDYDPFIDKNSREIFDNVLLKLLTRFTLTSKPLENQIESLPFEDFKLVIEGKIKNSPISKNLQKKYSDIIYSYLTSSSPNLLTFIFDSYSNLINIDIVMKEQEMELIDFLDELRFLLLDTSFLVAILCKTDPAHPLALAVVKQSIKRDIPLYYSSSTSKELWGVITASKYEMSGFSESKGHKIIRGQFVQDFRKQNISWYDYISIIESWKQLMKDKWGIIPVEKPLKIDEDVFQYVCKTLRILDHTRNEDRMRNDPNYIPHIRDEPQFEHDALCIATIAHSRKSLNSSTRQKPIGPWFLTFDNLISMLNAAYLGENDDFGYVIQPRTLLNYLLVYSNIEFEKADKEAVAEAIVKFTARSPETKVTLEEYIRLINYKMGLDEVDIEIVKEIFLASPLREELERALKLDLGDEADKIAYKIVTDTTFVETIISERKTRVKLLNVAKKFRSVKKELNEEKAVREALERALKHDITVKTEIVTKIDLNIQADFNNLISSLEAENAFKDGILEKPSDISTKEKLTEWLEKVKKTIETSKTISDGIKTLLPVIVSLIGELTGK